MTSDNTRNELLERIGDILLGIKDELPQFTRELAEIRMALISIAEEIHIFRRSYNGAGVILPATEVRTDPCEPGLMIVRDNQK